MTTETGHTGRQISRRPDLVALAYNLVDQAEVKIDIEGGTAICLDELILLIREDECEVYYFESRLAEDEAVERLREMVRRS